MPGKDVNDFDRFSFIGIDSQAVLRCHTVHEHERPKNISPSEFFIERSPGHEYPQGSQDKRSV